MSAWSRSIGEQAGASEKGIAHKADLGTLASRQSGDRGVGIGPVIA